jgi:hypothetical protein
MPYGELTSAFAGQYSVHFGHPTLDATNLTLTIQAAYPGGAEASGDQAVQDLIDLVRSHDWIVYLGEKLVPATQTITPTTP